MFLQISSELLQFFFVFQYKLILIKRMRINIQCSHTSKLFTLLSEEEKIMQTSELKEFSGYSKLIHGFPSETTIESLMLIKWNCKEEEEEKEKACIRTIGGVLAIIFSNKYAKFNVPFFYSSTVAQSFALSPSFS